MKTLTSEARLLGGGTIRLVIVLLVVLMGAAPAGAQQVTTYTTSGVFYVPLYVTSITVETRGGGGAGGGRYQCEHLAGPRRRGWWWRRVCQFDARCHTRTDLAGRRGGYSSWCVRCDRQQRRSLLCRAGHQSRECTGSSRWWAGGTGNTTGGSPAGGAGGTVAASVGATRGAGTNGGNGATGLGISSGAGGAGGNSGGAGGAALTSGTSAGNAGSASGGGGGGARTSQSGGSQAGGSGAAGVVRITFTPSSPTAVRFQAFSASVDAGGGVLVRWRTGHEVSNLGFHVYRDGVRVTESLIAGSALLAGERTSLTAGNAYTWFDRGGHVLEHVHDRGYGSGWHEDRARAVRGEQPRRTRRASGARRPGGAARTAPAAAQAAADPMSRLLSQLGRPGSDRSRWFSTRTDDEAAPEALPAPDAMAVADVMTAAPDLLPSALANMRAVKLRVRDAGWYHVDAAQLVAAGMPAYVESHHAAGVRAGAGAGAAGGAAARAW